MENPQPTLSISQHRVSPFQPRSARHPMCARERAAQHRYLRRPSTSMCTSLPSPLSEREGHRMPTLLRVMAQPPRSKPGTSSHTRRQKVVAAPFSSIALSTPLAKAPDGLHLSKGGNFPLRNALQSCLYTGCFQTSKHHPPTRSTDHHHPLPRRDRHPCRSICN